MSAAEINAIKAHAETLGINVITDNDYLWIAEESLLAELTYPWQECKDDQNQTYYYNQETDESTWDHPMDAYYRNLFIQLKTKEKEQNKLILIESKHQEQQFLQHQKNMQHEFHVMHHNHKSGNKREITKLKKSIEHLKDVHKTKKNEFNLKESRLQRQIKKLKGERESFQGEIENLKQQLNTNTNKDSNLIEENKLLSNKVRELELEIQTLKTELSKANSHITALKSERDSLSSLSADTTNMTTVLAESRVKRLEAELQKSDNQASVEMTQMKEIVEEMNAEIEELKKKNQELESQVVDLPSFRVKITELEAEVESLTSDLENVTIVAENQLQTTSEEIQKRCETEKKNHELQVQLDKELEKNTIIRSDKIALSKKKDALMKQVTEFKLSISKNEDNLDKLRQQNVNLNRSLQELKTSKTSGVPTIVCDDAAANERIEQLQLDLEHLKQQHKEEIAEISEFHSSKLVHFEKQGNSLKIALDKATTALGEKNRLIEEFHQHNKPKQPVPLSDADAAHVVVQKLQDKVLFYKSLSETRISDNAIHSQYKAIIQGLILEKIELKSKLSSEY